VATGWRKNAVACKTFFFSFFFSSPLFSLKGSNMRRRGPGKTLVPVIAEVLSYFPFFFFSFFFSVGGGEAVLLLGPKGDGNKTTLFSAIPSSSFFFFFFLAFFLCQWPL